MRTEYLLGYGHVDLSQVSLSVHGTPMFHGIGVLMYCLAVRDTQQSPDGHKYLREL